MYSYAAKLEGPWSPWKEFAAPGSKTYESQSSAILPLGNQALYMGDRWCPSNLAQSTYVWLPLEKHNHRITMTNWQCWSLDVTTESWANLTTKHHYKDEKVVPGASFSCHIHSDVAKRITFCILYTNVASQGQQVVVNVNNFSHKVDFLPTGDGKQGVKETGETVLHCNLLPNMSNIITMEAIPEDLDIYGLVVCSET